MIVLKKIILIGAILLLMLCTYGAIKNLITHKKEIAEIKTFLRANQLLENRKLDKSLAIKVSDALRKDFNTDEESWKFTSRKDEPFLRYSALELLKYREGKCGKGTRVIVKILQHLGYDATRISLYGRNLSAHSGHTLISILIDGKEYFIDSVNSSDKFNSFIKENDINTDDFNLSSYNNRFNKENTNKEQALNYVSENYILYNYGIPYSKIFYKLGIELEVFNFKRPSKYINYLAESVYLMKFLFFCLLAILCILICLSLKRQTPINQSV